MEERDQTLAAPLRRDQRCSIGKRDPRAVAQRGIGLCQHLSVHRDIGRYRHAEKWAFSRKCGEWLRLLPREAPAQDAPAATELDRHELIIAGSETGSRETHEHAA